MSFDVGSKGTSSWTLRKMSRKNESYRTFNIAVVGLSGPETERGCLGSGKSCLCNRFVRPFADDYYTDHLSVLSQSDFNGRIVNNDHWLYWGEVSKITEEGVELHFSVTEQTEFLDDACLQPFKPGGKSDAYHKRASCTRLCSSEKLMYICKNQLGIEKEYEQRYLPDGKFMVDGFVVVFDVSDIQGRTLEKNLEHTALLLSSLMKTKKPIVVATTKNDECNDIYVREAERLVNRKDFRGCIPLIETSSHDNVNVDLAFVVCAQLGDRSKGRAKMIPYYEAIRYRKEALNFATESFHGLLRLNVTDFRTGWPIVCKTLAGNPEFLAYCDLFGQEAAHRMFQRHVKRLRDDYLARKLQMYLRVLPEVLAQMVPDLDMTLCTPEGASAGSGTIGSTMDWESVKDRLRCHPDRDQYFLGPHPGQPAWHDVESGIPPSDTRIPWDMMDTPEAEATFLDYARNLEGEDRRRELRCQFKEHLAETGFVTPGKSLQEVRVCFMGRECYESLTEQDLREVYDEYQRDIIEVSKRHFQELLLEHSELFYHFASFGPGSLITQDDVFKITQILAQDVRYSCLDRLEQDRMLMLLRHLGFIHGPIREHCPAFPACLDVVIQKVVPASVGGSTGVGTGNRNGFNHWDHSVSEASLSIVILGAAGLGHDLARLLRNVNEKLQVSDIHYSLDLRVIDGDIDLAHNSFRTADFVPQGCLCIYSNHQTLEYVTDSVEKTLLSNLEAGEDRLPFLGLPLSILYAAEPEASPKDRIMLCEEGENRARSLQCPFYDVTYSMEGGGSNGSLISSDSPSGASGPSNDNLSCHSHSHSFREDGVRRALKSLIDCFQHKSANQSMNLLTAREGASSKKVPPTSVPDLRILMCFFCGDPFPLDSALACFLQDRSCSLTSPNSVLVELGVDGQDRTVEVILTSYHGAQAFRDELLHGFILVFSTQRRASLATLAAFSRNIPNTPTQMIGLTDGQPIYCPTEGDISAELVIEGNNLADKIRAHFLTTSCDRQKLSFFVNFFKDALERKPQIEAAFDLDNSEDSMEDSTNIGGHEGGIKSDVDDDYEEVPSEPIDLLEGPGHHIRNRLGHISTEQTPTNSASPGVIDDHLMKPSQVRNRRSLHGASTGSSSNHVSMSKGPGSQGSTAGVVSQPASSSTSSHLQFVSESPPPLPPHHPTGTILTNQSEPFVRSPLSSSSCSSNNPSLSSTRYNQPTQPQHSQHSKNMAQQQPHHQQTHHHSQHSTSSSSHVLVSPQPAFHQMVMDEGTGHSPVVGGAGGRKKGGNRSSPSTGGVMSSPPPPYGGFRTGMSPSPPPPPAVGYLSQPDFLPAHHHSSECRMNAVSRSMTVEGIRARINRNALRLRNVLPDRQSTAPGGGGGSSGGSGGAGSRAPYLEVEGSLESDDLDEDTLSYHYPPPDPAPPDLFRDHPDLLTASASSHSPGDDSIHHPGSHGWTEKGSLDLGIVSDSLLPTTKGQDWLDDRIMGYEGYAYQDVSHCLPRQGSPQPTFGAPFSSNHATSTSTAAITPTSSSSGSQRVKPGKLNLRQFDNITDAVGKLSFTSASSSSTSHHKGSSPFGLSGSSLGIASSGLEDDSRGGGDTSEDNTLHPPSSTSSGSHLKTPKSLNRNKEPSADKGSDTESDWSSSENKQGPVFSFGNRTKSGDGKGKGKKKGRGGIPVAPPKLPSFDGQAIPSFASSFGASNVIPASPSSSTPFSKLLNNGFSLEPVGVGTGGEDGDSFSKQFGMSILKSRSSSGMNQGDSIPTSSSSKDKKKQREEEKQEKRRVKEEEKHRRQLEKKNKKKGKGPLDIEDFLQSETTLVPLFVEKCIYFIDEEGLNLEGIYRVPGNRAHVDLLFAKFDEDPNVCIHELDIPVNAVATALKDFFSKRLPPVMTVSAMNDLTDIASVQDRGQRLLALKQLLRKFPSVNFRILKFIFAHFVRISENSKTNSMDSKNLAICWWPTLLPLEFNDMLMFERMRPHLEESVQTMIDQFSLLFEDEELVV